MSRRKQSKDTSSIMNTPRTTRSNDKTIENEEAIVEEVSDIEEPEDESMLEGDPNETVTMGPLKELLMHLQENINSNTDSTIKVIQKDVSYIKTTLETYGERFDDVENRISEAEDRIDKVEEVGGEMDILREQFEKSIEQGKIEACNARKKNMIINGIPGTSGDQKEAMATLTKLCVEELQLGEAWFKECGLGECYRFPAKKRTDPWPLFISFSSTRPKDDMFKASPLIKGKGYSFRHDLAPHLVEERNQLLKTSFRLRQGPEKYLTKMRETPYKVWLEYRKTPTDKWDTWKGNPPTT